MTNERELSKMFNLAYTEYLTISEEDYFSKLILDEEIKSLDTENRWSLSTVHNRENISQHSFWVVLFTWILCKKGDFDSIFTSRAMSYALFHDLDEIFTGDLNHKFKYDKNNGLDLEKIKEYGRLKCHAKLASFGINESDIQDVFNQDATVKKLVKFADWLSALQFLNFELALGNRTTKVRTDFLYCLVGVADSIKQLLTELSFTDQSHLCNDLINLYEDINKINLTIYTDEEE